MYRPPHHHATSAVKAIAHASAAPRPTQSASQAASRNERQRSPEDPPGIVEELADALAPGSFIAISHLTADMAPEQVTSGVAAYNSLVSTGITARSHSQVTALFGGLSLVPPGVVPVAEWRPVAGCHQPQSADMYAGAGRHRQAGRQP